ncbi:hypothetical protein DCAR_0832483 [Daucus carota subsp. sativus]|uniref:Uncharacterized protein n=1 Tax=Daucus carota subsp. sativus TaxID=79200 RepID=A0A175YQX1_DAUCS|nr:hypothetical protein DCAR_0832483 [Daucus carota subsp. sativus]
MVEMRKNRREENLEKKRPEGVQDPQVENLSATAVLLEQRSEFFLPLVWNL